MRLENSESTGYHIANQNYDKTTRCGFILLIAVALITHIFKQTRATHVIDTHPFWFEIAVNYAFFRHK